MGGDQNDTHEILQCNKCVVVCVEIGGWDKTNGEKKDGESTKGGTPNRQILANIFGGWDRKCGK